jgi:hypothetical protein
MPNKDIFVRGIDEGIYLEFKSKTVLQKKKLGEALNEAMKAWIEKYG